MHARGVVSIDQIFLKWLVGTWLTIFFFSWFSSTAFCNFSLEMCSAKGFILHYNQVYIGRRAIDLSARSASMMGTK